jgi:hypothetical protein
MIFLFCVCEILMTSYFIYLLIKICRPIFSPYLILIVFLFPIKLSCALIFNPYKIIMHSCFWTPVIIKKSTWFSSQHDFCMIALYPCSKNYKKFLHKKEFKIWFLYIQIYVIFSLNFRFLNNLYLIAS